MKKISSIIKLSLISAIMLVGFSGCFGIKVPTPTYKDKITSEEKCNLEAVK